MGIIIFGGSTCPWQSQSTETPNQVLGCLDSKEHVGWTPLPVRVNIRDNGDYIKVRSSSYYTTITRCVWGGGGVHLRNMH